MVEVLQFVTNCTRIVAVRLSLDKMRTGRDTPEPHQSRAP